MRRQLERERGLAALMLAQVCCRASRRAPVGGAEHHEDATSPPRLGDSDGAGVPAFALISPPASAGAYCSRTRLISAVVTPAPVTRKRPSLAIRIRSAAVGLRLRSTNAPSSTRERMTPNELLW